MAKALRARPPLGQRSSPWRRRPRREGGGGRARSMSATDLWPSAKAAEMRPKMSLSDVSELGGGGGGLLFLGRGGG